MLQKSYTFLNEEITAIHREGYYLWVATTPATGNAKLYKISVQNPEIIYYTITTEFLIVNKIVSGGYYIYITGEWTNYVYSKYSKTYPLEDYYHIDTEVGYESLRGNDLTFDTSHSMIHILHSGNESLQSPVLFTYDENDELYNTLELSESGTIIGSAIAMSKDEYNDYLYFGANYDGIANLVQVNIGSAFEVYNQVLLESSQTGNVQSSAFDATNNFLYLTTDTAILIKVDTTSPEALILENYDYLDSNVQELAGTFYNSYEDKLYFTGVPDTQIFNTNVLSESNALANLNEFATVSSSYLIDGYSELQLLFLSSGSDLIMLDNSTRKVIDTDLRIMFQKTKTILTNLFMIQTKKVNTDFRTKGIETKLVYTDLRYRV
jgi:hypothetical protein